MTTRDGGERLLRTVEALGRQTMPLQALIVVDSASRDDSAARACTRFPGATLITLDVNGGPSVARNAGLRRATTRLVLTVDYDISLGPECLERLVAHRERTNALAACPRILLHPERHIVHVEGADAHFVGTLVLRHGYQPVSELPSEPALVGAVPGGCLLVDREPVLAAGGFDESIFFYFEDLEFSLRLRGRGHQFVAVPDAQAFHDRGTGSPELAFRGAGPYPRERFHLTLRHRLLSILLHYRARTLLVLAPALALYELATIVLALRRGMLGEWWRAWRWQLQNAASIRGRRRAIQRGRVCPDREILVGGPLPLAPGVLGSGEARAARYFGELLDLYWRAVRRWAG